VVLRSLSQNLKGALPLVLEATGDDAQRVILYALNRLVTEE